MHEWSRAQRQLDNLIGENRALRPELPDLVAQSPAMQPVLDLVQRIGPSDANVLITGENGTGKGLIARLLHQASGRAGKPLITVDVGALSESLLESELFGHVRGAFTDARADREGRFELADGATIFLDEIANLPLGQQAKLLRVLETGEFERVGASRTRRVDARVLAATNASLEAEVAAGRFRQDLRFRLNTVEVRLPPLRERREDIAPLAARFVARFAQKYRRSIADIHPAALDALLAHSWPGNIRELAHAVERAVLMAHDGTITASDLGLTMSAPANPPANLPADLPADIDLHQMQARLIRQTVDRCGGNVEQAAVVLGLSRSALYRRIKKLSV